MTEDKANIILWRDQFVEGSDFPDRRLYALYSDPEKKHRIGYMSIADDGTVGISQNTSASESWKGWNGDVAAVDKGNAMPGRGFKVMDR